jgi:VPDSG-CTERM motif
MKKSFLKFLTVAGIAGLLANAQASTIVTGTIFNNGSGSTVDHIYFTTGSNGLVTIDLLSWENDTNGFGADVDLNGDGEIAYFDPYIYLFNNDGSLDAGDLITANDDSGATFGDGSIYGYDSYLSLNLSAGSYILAVGAFYLDTLNAIDGFNDGNTYPWGPNFSSSAHGDYQVTFSTNVTVAGVPDAGGTLALLGLSILAFVGIRRKLVR